MSTYVTLKSLKQAECLPSCFIQLQDNVLCDDLLKELWNLKDDLVNMNINPNSIVLKLVVDKANQLKGITLNLDTTVELETLSEDMQEKYNHFFKRDTFQTQELSDVQQQINDLKEKIHQLANNDSDVLAEPLAKALKNVLNDLNRTLNTLTDESTLSVKQTNVKDTCSLSDIVPNTYLWAVQWEESERGWGCRPDGYSFHVSEKEAEHFITAYHDKLPKEVPNEYSRVVNKPFLTEVSVTLYKHVQQKKSVWLSLNNIEAYKTYVVKT